MQFQIPQFIEVEDKIFGPLTFRQFIYVVGAVGGSYLIYRVLPIYIALPIVIPIIALGAALAFFQYNGRPFILALESGFAYLIHPKLYLWNNERKRDTPAKKADAPTQSGEVYVPKLSDSKLHELAWSLDIKERLAAGVGDEADKGSRVGTIVAPVMTMRSAIQEQSLQS